VLSTYLSSKLRMMIMYFKIAYTLYSSQWHDSVAMRSQATDVVLPVTSHGPTEGTPTNGSSLRGRLVLRRWQCVCRYYLASLAGDSKCTEFVI